MKNLSEKEFYDAPNTIQVLYYKSIMKHPIGYDEYKKAIKEYPEYFPEEVEHERKWNFIPKNIHNEYWTEMEILRKEIFKDLPEGRGILFWINNPNELKIWQDQYEKLKIKGLPKAKKLHQKFYSPYGIEWNDNQFF